MKETRISVLHSVNKKCKVSSVKDMKDDVIVEIFCSGILVMI